MPKDDESIAQRTQELVDRLAAMDRRLQTAPGTWMELAKVEGTQAGRLCRMMLPRLRRAVTGFEYDCRDRDGSSAIVVRWTPRAARPRTARRV
jgi:hypothetical protein